MSAEARRDLAPIKEAAAYVGCSEKTIRRAIARGDLPAYRFGRLIRIDRSELDALMRPMATAKVG